MLREIKFNGQKIKFDERDEVDRSVAAEIFKIREYRIAEPAISQAKTIVDVGAHIGLFSLYCHTLNSNVKIIALEPEPNNLKRLAEILKLNKIFKVKILPIALAGETGKAQLILASDSHNHHLGDLEATGEGIEVKTTNLSDLKKQFKIKQIDVLKMDIEGGEFTTVDNWQLADFASIKTLILEYHEQFGQRENLENKLRENGFGVQIFPSKFDKNMGFIFANNKRIKI